MHLPQKHSRSNAKTQFPRRVQFYAIITISFILHIHRAVNKQSFNCI